ncbi:MAG: hypothetical protein ACHQQR_16730, partial [Gemmatimonadales bacterium]
MRLHRSMVFLTIATTLAACSSPGASANAQPDAAPPAAAPVAAAPAPDPGPAVAINVRWDSGPLDLAYRRERSDMDARHVREVAAPRSGETSIQLGARHAAESKTLELRYSRGKSSHARTMPP